MAQNQSPLPTPDYYRGPNLYGQSPRSPRVPHLVLQGFPRSYNPTPLKSSAGPSSSSFITIAESEEGNTEDGYEEEDAECEQGDQSRRRVGGKGKNPHTLSRESESQSPPKKPKKNGTGRGPFYACPYFKNNPLEHQSCAGWGNRGTHRVKEHCKRYHLKPNLCFNCGYRTGDRGQLAIHIPKCRTRAETVTRVPLEIAEKAASLEARGLSWEQMYGILFPGDELPPSPYGVKTTHVVPRTPPRPRGHPSHTHGDTLTHYTKFLQVRLKILPEEMKALLHEYRDTWSWGSPSYGPQPHSPQPHGQPPPRTTFAEYDGISTEHGYNNFHTPIQHPTVQSSNVPESYQYVRYPPDGFYGGSPSSQLLPNSPGPSFAHVDETLSELLAGGQPYQCAQLGRGSFSYFPPPNSLP